MPINRFQVGVNITGIGTKEGGYSKDDLPEDTLIVTIARASAPQEVLGKLYATEKEFRSGSVGYYAGGKVEIYNE
jgi:hypothetical protein